MINEFMTSKEIEFDSIDPSALDPVLKCIQGDYTNRFVYINNCNPDE